jgi:hypothetical protein
LAEPDGEKGKPRAYTSGLSSCADLTAPALLFKSLPVKPGAKTDEKKRGQALVTPGLNMPPKRKAEP